MESKVVIIRRPSFRWEGVAAAAKKLKVAKSSLRVYLAGATSSLGKSKRDRIVIKTIEN